METAVVRKRDSQFPQNAHGKRWTLNSLILNIHLDWLQTNEDWIIQTIIVFFSSLVFATAMTEERNNGGGGALDSLKRMISVLFFF